MQDGQDQTECHQPERRTSQSIDWYSPGESRAIEINGVEVTVRFVGRKGRRARIAITAPAGAVFCELDLDEFV